MKNKKSLMAIIIAVLVVTGITIAYFTSSVSFENNFGVATYKTTTTEEFVGPTNWKPGEEIPKTVTTTNEGNIPVAVRVSYSENWKDKNGDDLDPQPEGKVTINLDNTRNWTKEGNYYYYNYPLEPNETTKSFMKSVTLNSDAISSDSIQCTTSADGKSKTCEAVDDLAGATYTLTLTIETIQYDAYADVWNPSIEIKPYVSPVTFVNRQNENSVTIGDLVKIGDTEEFYVVSSDSEKTVLLAHYNLNVGNNKKTDVPEGRQDSRVRGFVESTGEAFGLVGFSSTNYWWDKIGEGNIYPGSYNDPNYPYVYSSSSNLIVDYVNDYKDLIEEESLDVIKARLLSYQEAKALGCTSNSCSSALSWVYETSYWTGSALDAADIYAVWSSGGFGDWIYYRENRLGVRPVIEIATSEIPN